MADENLIVIPIPAVQGMDEILKPSTRPIMGEQRLVRFLPVPGTDKLFPAIWISPYTHYQQMDPLLGGPAEPTVVCLVLISKGPPKPDVVCVSIDPAALHKFPMAPVEW
jgi:hypothetical protein